MTKVYGQCYEQIGAFNDTRYIMGMMERVSNYCSSGNTEATWGAPTPLFNPGKSLQFDLFYVSQEHFRYQHVASSTYNLLKKAY